MPRRNGKQVTLDVINWICDEQLSELPEDLNLVYANEYIHSRDVLRNLMMLRTPAGKHYLEFFGGPGGVYYVKRNEPDPNEQVINRDESSEQAA